PVNGPVFSNLVRYEVLEYLRAHGIDAREEEEGEEQLGPIDGCDRRSLPNNGLELIYRGSCLRVRKGLEPPMPTTQTQKNWYQQNLFVSESDVGTVLTNLL